jgi:hypothetical protein
VPRSPASTTAVLEASMSETAWWLIVGVALLLAIAGALRFDLLGAMLRDKLEHPDAPPPLSASAAAAQAERAAAEAGEHHAVHAAAHRKAPSHRRGRR